MTTKRTYVCDFCRKETDDSSEFHGLKWSSSVRLTRCDAGRCEHHLCTVCLDAITEVGNEFRSERPDSPESGEYPAGYQELSDE